MDVLKDLTNVFFLRTACEDPEETDMILYTVYARLLKDQERLLKKAGEWNI